MRHARDEDLDRLEDLLEALRALPGLTEKTRGVFYRGARAFLHFHQDPAGLFADVRNLAGDDFERIDVTHPDGRARLAGILRARLS